jgi:hypothetical protein
VLEDQPHAMPVVASDEASACGRHASVELDREHRAAGDVDGLGAVALVGGDDHQGIHLAAEERLDPSTLDLQVPVGAEEEQVDAGGLEPPAQRLGE